MRWTKNVVSSREVNISVSRWSPSSYAKEHGLTDLLCPKCPLSFSLQIVSLQSRHCCFGRASFYGKPHPFWFVHVTVDAMVSSQKYLRSQLFWSRNGLPRCLARWNYPPGAQDRWLCTEGVTKEAPRRLPGVLLRAFNLLDPACYLRESSLCNQGCNQQLRLPRAIRMAGENKYEASTRERHSHYSFHTVFHRGKNKHRPHWFISQDNSSINKWCWEEEKELDLTCKEWQERKINISCGDKVSKGKSPWELVELALQFELHVAFDNFCDSVNTIKF